MNKRLKRLVDLKETLKKRAEAETRQAELALEDARKSAPSAKESIAERRVEVFLDDSQAAATARAFEQHLEARLVAQKTKMQRAYQEHKQVEKVYLRRQGEASARHQKREAQQVENWLRSRGDAE